MVQKEFLLIDENPFNTSMHLHLDYTSDILCFPQNRSSRMAASHEREREREKEKNIEHLRLSTVCLLSFNCRSCFLFVFCLLQFSHKHTQHLENVCDSDQREPSITERRLFVFVALW